MTGICKALTTEISFLEFFNVIYNDIWDLISIPINNEQNPELLWTILKFCKEFVNNRNLRLSFDESELYVIIIFKNISQLLLFYCKKHIVNQSIEDETEKAKIVLNIVNNMISGGYICFESFEVYNENNFVSMISACFDLISRISGDLKAKNIWIDQKLMVSIYNFLEYLCKNFQIMILSDLHHKCYSCILAFINYAIQTNSKSYLDLKF
jgi:hypothetical protein